MVKKRKNQKNEKKPWLRREELSVDKEFAEDRGTKILELAASFWDAERPFPTERRA